MNEEDAELIVKAFANWLSCAETLTGLADMPDMLFEHSLVYVNPKAHSLLKMIRDVSKALPTREEHVLMRVVLDGEKHGTAN